MARSTGRLFLTCAGNRPHIAGSKRPRLPQLRRRHRRRPYPGMPSRRPSTTSPPPLASSHRRSYTARPTALPCRLALRRSNNRRRRAAATPGLLFHSWRSWSHPTPGNPNSKRPPPPFTTPTTGDLAWVVEGGSGLVGGRSAPSTTPRPPQPPSLTPAPQPS